MNNPNEAGERHSPAVLRMVQPWLTGDDEHDAQTLRRQFRVCRLSIAQWRDLIAQSSAQEAA